MSADKKPEISKNPSKTSPDAPITPSKKGADELADKELGYATGGTIPSPRRTQ